MLIVSGNATVIPTDKTSGPIALAAGDAVHFHKGFRCAWHVTQPMTKRYAYFGADGKESVPAQVRTLEVGVGFRGGLYCCCCFLLPPKSPSSSCGWSVMLLLLLLVVTTSRPADRVRRVRRGVRGAELVLRDCDGRGAGHLPTVLQGGRRRGGGVAVRGGGVPGAGRGMQHPLYSTCCPLISLHSAWTAVVVFLNWCYDP